MNWKYFVDRYVMVQFREQQYMVPHAVGEKAMPTAVAVPDPRNQGATQQVPVAVPFLVGKVAERDGSYFVHYMDHQGVKLEVAIDEGAVFTVSAVCPDRIVAP